MFSLLKFIESQNFKVSIFKKSNRSELSSVNNYGTENNNSNSNNTPKQIKVLSSSFRKKSSKRPKLVVPKVKSLTSSKAGGDSPSFRPRRASINCPSPPASPQFVIIKLDEKKRRRGGGGEGGDVDDIDEERSSKLESYQVRFT